jgi:hypothetical protein
MVRRLVRALWNERLVVMIIVVSLDHERPTSTMSEPSTEVEVPLLLTSLVYFVKRREGPRVDMRVACGPTPRGPVSTPNDTNVITSPMLESTRFNSSVNDIRRSVPVTLSLWCMDLYPELSLVRVAGVERSLE